MLNNYEIQFNALDLLNNNSNINQNNYNSSNNLALLECVMTIDDDMDIEVNANNYDFISDMHFLNSYI